MISASIVKFLADPMKTKNEIQFSSTQLRNVHFI